MSKQTEYFIAKHAADVVKSVKGTGFFPSIKMAQMIIESSGRDENGKFTIGRGLAVRKANNYFGIKADSRWQGKKVALNTPKDGKPVSLFRVYPSTLDSLKDHTQFLLVNPRYKKHGVFQAKNPIEQAAALQKSGYSESATYGKALIALIKAYKLEQLDTSLGSAKEKKQSTGNTLPLLLIGGTALVVVGSYYLTRNNEPVTTH